MKALLAALILANPGAAVPVSREPPAAELNEVQKFLQMHRRELVRVFNDALQRDPALHGALALKLTIETSGQVSKAEAVDVTLNDPDVVKRLCRAAEAWKLAPHAGGAWIVKMPLNLKMD
ncbi:MAG: AgmX/PglI C-terminal domain-containing protein [Deltaproteobacteria bacterium]|nr:AgmX/PglI C-terminal domain-containing protein [Deltaproteobacteria bacterium]